MRKWAHRIAAVMMILWPGFFYVNLYVVFKYDILIEEGFIGASTFNFLLFWIIFVKTKPKIKPGLETEEKSKRLVDKIANVAFYTWVYIFAAVIVFIFVGALLGF
jgi:hypothetical protein